MTVRGSRIAADALILALVAVAVVTVDPRGDFPLDDDWNFALTTWRFAETGELVYSRFTAMTLKTQVAWGALWTKCFGASFEVLRASTLALFALAVLLFHRWVRDLELPPRAAAIATASFALHPVLFWSAFTYMTHVPFLVLSVAALRCFDVGIRRESARWVAAGGVAVVAAFFLRQTGIALALPPLVILWLRRRSLPRAGRLVTIAAAPVALFVALYAFTDLLAGYPGQILEHFRVWQVSPAEFPARLANVGTRYTFFNLQNAALFLLPLTLAFVATVRPPGRRWALAGGAFAGAGFLLGLNMINRGFPMPYWSLFARWDVHPGNVLVSFGLGPQTLPDLWVWNMPPPFPLTVGWSYLLTVLSGALGGVAAWALALAWRTARERNERQRTAIELLVMHGVTATAALLVSGIYFDRYCIDSLWGLAVIFPILIDWHRARATVIATVTLVAVGAFAILGTQEYLEWNRARWTALGELRDTGVSLEEIDGGYEVNQYLIGGFDGPVHLRKYGFSVIDNRYLLAFNRVPGYRILRRHEFESFLGLRKGVVLTLLRDDRRARDPGPASSGATPPE